MALLLERNWLCLCLTTYALAHLLSCACNGIFLLNRSKIELEAAPRVSFSGLFFTPDQFPGLVLCPKQKNAYATIEREDSGRVE